MAAGTPREAALQLPGVCTVGGTPEQAAFELNQGSSHPIQSGTGLSPDLKTASTRGLCHVCTTLR